VGCFFLGFILGFFFLVFFLGGGGGLGGLGGYNGDDGDEGDNGDMVFERPRVVAMTPVLRKAMEIVMREDEGLTEDGGGG